MRAMNLFISPHNDDETLFGAYTLCRERETIQVVIVFDGYVQIARGHTTATHLQRREETRAALRELGVVASPIFLEFNDTDPDPWKEVRLQFMKLRSAFDPVTVYAPYVEPHGLGHPQHDAVGNIAMLVWNQSVRRYLTYSTQGKSRSLGSQQTPEPDWIIRKHRALACYKSQVEVPNCREHFERDLREYVVYPADE